MEICFCNKLEFLSIILSRIIRSWCVCQGLPNHFLAGGSIVYRSLLFSFDFVFKLQLLRRNPERRLGASEKDAEDVRKQPFFRVRNKADKLVYSASLDPFGTLMHEINHR